MKYTITDTTIKMKVKNGENKIINCHVGDPLRSLILIAINECNHKKVKYYFNNQYHTNWSERGEMVIDNIQYDNETDNLTNIEQSCKTLYKLGQDLYGNNWLDDIR